MIEDTKTFVEIGAADFDTLQPLAEQGWYGFVVEPNPTLAVECRKIFAEYPRVTVHELAISDIDGEVEMVFSHGTGWEKGISHVTSPNHLGERLSDYQENKHLFLKPEMVVSQTLDTFLDTVDSEIDFMKVDVEGHENNIFGAYSFRIKPTFLKIEHKHVDDRILGKYLTDAGYTIWVERDDIYAVI